MAKHNQSFTVVHATSVSAGWECFLMPVAVCKIVWFLVKVWVFSLQPMNIKRK